MATTTAPSSSEDCSPTVRVHVLWLSPPPVKFLAVYQKKDYVPEQDWFLPRFEYSPSSSYESSYCCRDLKKCIGLESEASNFQVVAELMPSSESRDLSCFYNPGGAARLTLVEAQSESLLKHDLPPHAKWTDPEDLLKIFWTTRLYRSEYKYVRGPLATFLGCFSEKYSSPSDPRCQHDWVYRAARYLKSVVRNLQLQPTSNVERVSHVSTAELFKVNTCQGWYYLKAPSAGTPEVAVTDCVAKLFPMDTLSVVSTNTTLNCFVSKGFGTVGEIGDSMIKVMLRKLAKVQHDSIKHLGVLRGAGLPDYSPAALAAEVDEWFADPEGKQAMGKRKTSLEELRHTLKKFCAALDSSPIPCTVVHGDFVERNFGVSDDVGHDRSMILFDWGRACVAHPFCDLYRWDFSQQQEMLQEYFRSWDRFVSVEEAQYTLEVAKIVGWMVSMGSVVKMLAVGTKTIRRLADGYRSTCIDRLISLVREKAAILE